MEHNWKREKDVIFLSRMLLYSQITMDESDELENEKNNNNIFVKKY